MSPDEFLDRIGLKDQFSFSMFVQGVQAYLSRNIFFLPWQFPPEMTGACLQSENALYVFYAEGTIPAHQTLIKLHELVHAVLGHNKLDLDNKEESIIREAIEHTNHAYNANITSLVMRSFNESSLEADVDNLAMALLQRLLPERSGSEQSLASLDLD